MSPAKLKDTRSIYQNSIVFLHTRNEQSKNKETVSFTITHPK